jgi:hypothetical protein
MDTWEVVVGLAAVAALAIAWVVLRRGLAQPRVRDFRGFVAELVRHLEGLRPHVEWRGLASGSLHGVVAVEGQDTLVPLAPLHRHYVAFPEEFPAVVQRLILDIKATGLDRSHEHHFIDVFQDIVPQIRSLEWLDTHGAAFGGAALVHRDLGDGNVLCYAIDGGDTVVFVCRAHAQQWGKSEEDLFHLSRSNARAQESPG